MRTGHQRVPRVLSSMPSVICPQGFCWVCWQEQLQCHGSSSPSSPEALDIPHVQDGVGVPGSEPHALVGHIIHLHVASATGRAHEEPARGQQTLRVLSWGETHPYHSRHGTASSQEAPGSSLSAITPLGSTTLPRQCPAPLARAPSPCPHAHRAQAPRRAGLHWGALPQTSPDFYQTLRSCSLLLAGRKPRGKAGAPSARQVDKGEDTIWGKRSAPVRF